MILFLCGMAFAVLLLMVILPSEKPTQKLWEEMSQEEKNKSNAKALGEIYGTYRD